MKRNFFGTDGVRGSYGGPLINTAFFERLGRAAGLWAGGSGAVVLGRDTRQSGEALLRAAASGLLGAGLKPRDLGVLPTPAVSLAVRMSGAALGAMVTASHNPASDNGIKFFRRDGQKLTDGEEARIEALMQEGAQSEEGIREGVMPSKLLSHSREQLTWHDPFSDEYVKLVSTLLPPGALKGWRVVLDTANGATCATSPAVLAGLGAEVIPIGNAPDGRNINDGVGSEHPGKLASEVVASGARLGVAHDGDGDRCVLCDEFGAVLDGDEILTILAVDALGRGALAARTLVVTVQSNLGVDAAVEAAGGRVARAPVGDRYVVERMLAEGATLGGESSGHLIFSEFSPSGDGLVAALKVIGVMLATGRPLSELRRMLRKFPQASESVVVREKTPIEQLPALTEAIHTLEAELGSKGRVLVRYSGTEPKLRFLVEGPTEEITRAGLARLKAALK